MVYFSEKELSQKPRTLDDLTATAWAKIVAAIDTRIADGSFGRKFPRECEHCIAPVGTSLDLMGQAVRRELPYLTWPTNVREIPNLYDALDLIQFCYDAVSSPFKSKGFCNRIVRHLAFNDPKGEARISHSSQ